MGQPYKLIALVLLVSSIFGSLYTWHTIQVERAVALELEGYITLVEHEALRSSLLAAQAQVAEVERRRRLAETALATLQNRIETEDQTRLERLKELDNEESNKSDDSPVTDDFLGGLQSN